MDNNLQQTTNNIDYNMAEVKQKPNIILGTIGALIAAILGAVIWIIVTWKTGYIVGILGMGIVWLAMFLYEKLAKGIDTIGIIICIVLSFAAIYAGNRIGTVFIIQDTFNSAFGAYSDVTFSDANDYFSVAMEDSEFKSAYIQDMFTGYAFSIVCSVALVINKFKQKKNKENKEQING